MKFFCTTNRKLSTGHECWDHVSVWSCWGRCDSREISDWKFPYKKSYHPVCVHAGRSKAVAMLRYCHPSADPETRRYEYLEANACHCQVNNYEKIKNLFTFFLKKRFSVETDLLYNGYKLRSTKQYTRRKFSENFIDGWRQPRRLGILMYQ